MVKICIIIIIIIILQEVLEGQENRQNHPFLFLPETHTQPRCHRRISKLDTDDFIHSFIARLTLVPLHPGIPGRPGGPSFPLMPWGWECGVKEALRHCAKIHQDLCSSFTSIQFQGFRSEWLHADPLSPGYESKCEADDRNVLEVLGFLGILVNQEGPAGTQAYQHHVPQCTVTPASLCIMTSTSGFLPARLSVQERQVHLSLPTGHKYAESDYNSLFCISYLLILLPEHSYSPWGPLALVALHVPAFLGIPYYPGVLEIHVHPAKHRPSAWCTEGRKNLKNQWDFYQQYFQ